MISPHIIWIGLALLSVGLYGVVKFWPEGGSSRTFSQHVAYHNTGVLYYILLFTLTLPIFAGFFFHWFIPTYQLPAIFGVFIAIGLIAQYLCTLVPEISTKRRAVHRGLAFVSALGLLLAIASTFFFDAFSLIDKAFLLAGLLIMIYFLVILISTNTKHPKVLYIQTGYFAAFFASILLVVYF